MFLKYHFIAIGGSIMHSLAIQLKKSGHTISGSDDVIFGNSAEKLRKEGLLPEQNGWFPEKITSDLDAVILGMHAKSDNPELIRARELNLKIYSFPAFIYELSKNKKRIVVGGSHGKTTITAMILHVLHHFHIDVDYLIGAPVPGIPNQVKISDAPIIVLEGDEYLSSAIDPTPKFLKYKHNIGIISGIEWDHANVFPTEDNYIEQFEKFCRNGASDSVLIYNAEDPLVLKTARSFANPDSSVPYLQLSHSVKEGQTYLEDGTPLKIFGRHNLSNMGAAQKALSYLGIEEGDFRKAISEFEGARKRLQELNSSKGRVFLDFAHAPSKLKATVEAIREQFPNKKLIALYELHTYSSISRTFIPKYEGALNPADKAVVYFNPDNKSLPDGQLVTNEQIIEGFARPDLTVINKPNELPEIISSSLSEENILLLMSSGQFGGIDIPELLF